MFTAIDDLVHIVHDFCDVELGSEHIVFIVHVCLHHIIPLGSDVKNQGDISEQKSDAKPFIVIEKVACHDKPKGENWQQIFDQIGENGIARDGRSIDWRIQFREIHSAKIFIVCEDEYSDQLISHPLTQCV
jgi:hypothetical protein